MRRLAIIAGGVILASVSFSLASILIRYSLAAGAQPLPLAGWRLLTASVLTLALLELHGSKPRLSYEPGVLVMLVAGGLLFGLHMSLWNLSLSLASVAVAATIVNMYPIVMVIADNVLFKTRIAGRQYAGLALSITATSALTLSAGKSGGELWGALAAFASMLCVSGYLVAGKLLRHSISVLEYTFYVYLLGGLTALLFSAISGSSVLVPLEATPYVLLLAIIPTLLGHTVINFLARVSSLTIASIPPLLEPVGASLLAWVLLGESLLPFRWLAVLVAVCGALLIVSAEGRR